ncbi:MAG: TatD family hydrolase [Planctomycetota bacterium]|jgi:TatD DNase family protein
MLVDTHAHLQAEEFKGEEAEVIERSRAADVRVILTAGISVDSSRRAVEIANAEDGMYAAVGVQPNELGEAPPDWARRIRAMAEQPKVKAIGETGMDLYRDRTGPEQQRAALTKHLEMAQELDLPVILHSRAAGKEVLDVLEDFYGGGRVRGVMHCFTDKEPVMRRAVELGLHISFAGPLTYPISRKNREIVKKVPDGRLLIETDSPYLGAQPVKHRRNEPAYLRFVATKVAEMRRLSPRDVSRITTLNADNLFGLGVADRSPKIAYGIRSMLYLNITNRCTNSCTFCPRVWGEADEKDELRRGAGYLVKGHNLRLDKEPTAQEVIAAMGEISPYREVVFCGFGEPTLRLDVLLEVAKHVRALGQRVRLDTNGHGSLHHDRSIVPDLTEAVDAVSVSLNTATPEEYVKLCRPERGEAAFKAMVDFIKEAADRIPEVTVTAVDVPGIDMKAVKRLAKELKVRFHTRPYDEVG